MLSRTVCAFSNIKVIDHRLILSPVLFWTFHLYDAFGCPAVTETYSYDYNVRSWLTRINGPKFDQTLAYNTTMNKVTPITPQYGGNISAMKWRSGDETVERG
ncbi:hypothetical protein [Proteiniphilum sp. UBA5384]|uniref:hypothetical protein n=1 Tax=Proteiniphilum sp. UBA5384 TaxID=1947279 RepID=UPI0025E5F4AD|nr:hypothetical protein [Proteiniphilum sp. UBA5384]